jgi:hypothetical protein
VSNWVALQADIHDASLKAFAWSETHTKFVLSAAALLCAFVLGAVSCHG